jgi:hypothetical protein
MNTTTQTNTPTGTTLAEQYNATLPTFEHGFALGQAAFTDGRVAVPALDPAATGAVAGVPVGGAVEYWKGWLAGWHSANLLPTEEVAK